MTEFAEYAWRIDGRRYYRTGRSQVFSPRKFQKSAQADVDQKRPFAYRLLKCPMMISRLTLFTLLAIVSTASNASDALTYAFAYECNADQVNQDMVEACSRAYPELATPASRAYDAWRSRNAVKAKLAYEACSIDLKQKSKSGTRSESAGPEKMVANIQDEIRLIVRANIRENGPEFCIEALNQLEQGSGAIDLK